MDINRIKLLRKETKAGIADCKRALVKSDGDINKAKELLEKWGVAKATKKGDRQTDVGIVYAYIHAGGTVGALVSLACETDFVARTEEFKTLAREISMQVTAMDPKDAKELMKQAYIRNAKLTIEDLIKQTIAKVGENITVKAFSRQAF